MNDKLKNLTVQPAPEVWEKIDKSLRRRRALRLTTTAVAGLVLLAAVITGVVLWPSQQPAAKQLVAETPKDGGQPELLVVRDVSIPNQAVKAEPAAANTLHNQQVKNATSKAQEAVAAVTLHSEGSQPMVEMPSQSLEAYRQQPMAEETQHAPRPVASPVSKAAEPVAALAEAPASHDIQPAAAENKPAAVKSPLSNRMEDTILWIPNAFMPASDDAAVAVFRPRLTVPDASISNYKMTIFNRGGHIVFTSRDISTGWDGTYHGEEQVQAAYVYVIQYTDRENIQHQRRGTVTLIR